MLSLNYNILILADGSPQPDVVSHGVGGSAMFKENVETTILL